MYILTDVVVRIKERAKNKNKSISKMLEECNLSGNTLVSMSSRGSWIQADSLGKMADVLDCSVDYLLGRTESPDFHKEYTYHTNASVTDDQLAVLIETYNKLDTIGKARLLVMADELNRKGNS